MNAERLAGFGSICLGAGVAVAAILGPLGFEVISFRTSEHLRTQFVGGEVVSLAVVAPAAIAAGALWLRSSRLAPALAIGPAAYAAYTYGSVILGQEYGRYEGNVERFVPLYAALVAGGIAVAGTAWSALSNHATPAIPTGLVRALAAVFLGLGGLFALAWSRQIALVATSHRSAEYLESPHLFWTIKLFDCAFVIPLLLLTGIGLLRGHPRAARLATGLAGFATCLAGSVAGMAIAMEATDDPSAQPAMLVIILPVALGLALATVRLLRICAHVIIDTPRHERRTRPSSAPSGHPA